jgi:F0F1-type ATP synthase membrane subunit b/b'
VTPLLANMRPSRDTRPSRNRQGAVLLKRPILAIALGLSLGSYALPQEPAPAATQETEQGDPWLGWKWANFAILAVGLGYLISKQAPAYFRQRTKEIEQAIADATKLKQDAESRAAEVESRFAALQSEIETLRQTARAATAAEGQRISRETAQRLEKIKTQTAQEIALMTRAGRFELRKYSAQLALDLAEQRIRSRSTKDMQDGLVDAFLHDLHNRMTRAAQGLN